MGSTRPAPPLTVRVECPGRQAVAAIDQMRAIAKERLTKRIEDVSPEQLMAIEDSLREVLELGLSQPLPRAVVVVPDAEIAQAVQVVR